MAILGKIRERSMFLIIIIALALFSFVLTGLFDSNSPLFNKDTNYVGEINGEKIAREYFAQLVDQERARTGGRGSQLQNVKTAWDNLIREKVYETQLEKSGIIVGEKDVWDAIIGQPFVQNSPIFKNEVGLFDEEKLKEYVATLKDDSLESDEGMNAWLGWLNYEKSIKTNLELSTYSNLIKAGLRVTLKEGEYEYNDQNTKMDIEYVYVPFGSVSDSLVKVTNDEIENYVREHKEDYIIEPTINLNFVKFENKATAEDEEIIKNQLRLMINDREDYSSAAKSNIKVLGLKNTTDYKEFFQENNSDTPYNDKYFTKNQLSKGIADSIAALVEGEIYGPYKEGAFLRLTKLVETKQLPDSVKSSHIIVPFAGTARSTSTKTKEEARIVIDSIYALVKNSDSKFVEIANEINTDGTKGKGGDIGWVTLNQAYSPSFDRKFADFIYENKEGSVEVVETNFGFHVIKVDEQKSPETTYKLVTFSRIIEASEKTENQVFETAETFASQLQDKGDITELAKAQGYIVQPLQGLKILDEKVSNLGNQRQIVTWAFDTSTKVNDVKRFDIDNGYAIVKISKKNKKGLSLGGSKPEIRLKLLNQKKADFLNNKMTGTTLEEISKVYDVKVNSSKAVSVGSPSLPFVGRAPELVGGINNLEENKIYKKITARNGVFAVKILKKEDPVSIENYKKYTTSIYNKLQNKNSMVYDALKKFADIEDNRAIFY